MIEYLTQRKFLKSDFSFLGNVSMDFKREKELSTCYLS